MNLICSIALNEINFPLIQQLHAFPAREDTEGLYTRNDCVYRQFWHFSIIISLIINMNFYFQVSRITNDFLVYYLKIFKFAANVFLNFRIMI